MIKAIPPRLFITLLLAASAWTLATSTPAQTAEPAKVTVDKKAERVINGALRYLASKQQPNGSWSASEERNKYNIAMTGYVLMAFQSAGHLPGEGEFGESVTRGMNYLLDIISPEGLYGSGRDGQYMYSHGIATIALAELYGQSRSPTILAKLQSVVRLIVSAQADAEGHEGGWRYRPIAKDADISVTVLQLVAIRGAKNAGLDVPQKTIDDAVAYVKRCYKEDEGGFCYQPNREAGFARTAAAIYSLQVCGLYEDPMVKAGSKFLFEAQRADHEWFTYGNFYAAPAQYMIGGDTWKKWYADVKNILLDQVIDDKGAIYWEARGRGGVGATFTTAVYTMILSMPYHYIPLYQR
ncbi:MAG: terpene cyclase/mutase family protein [Verrucomicrobiae bacterium]|nr:terpene cyclase/mutase family protein [Verrucomicrobiae bacterium]